MLLRLHHVTVAVDDLPEANRCYSTLFGREADLESREEGVTSHWFALENVALELRQPAEAAGGPLELGFLVADFDEAEAWAQARGLAPTRCEAATTLLAPSSSSGASPRPRDLVRTSLALAPERTGGVRLSLLASGLPLDPRPCDDPGAVRGIDHAVVRTRDPDGTRALYETGLGLRVALDREFDQWGVRLVFCRLAGVTLELAAALDPARSSLFDDTEAPATRDSLWGLSWRVQDAERAHARLAALGVDVSEVRPGRKPGTRVFTVRDHTQGVPTLIIEPAER